VSVPKQTYGRLGKPLITLLRRLGVETTVAASLGAVSKSACVQTALCDLSVGLCWGNSVIYTDSWRGQQQHQKAAKAQTPHKQATGSLRHPSRQAVSTWLAKLNSPQAQCLAYVHTVFRDCVQMEVGCGGMRQGPLTLSRCQPWRMPSATITSHVAKRRYEALLAFHAAAEVDGQRDMARL
jgi:hypothetical protein